MPMLVARVGYNDGLDKDIYTVAQNDLHPQRTVKAMYIDGMYMKDTRIGHSTVLQVRTSEKSLLMDTNWNPFLAETPLDKGSFWQSGWDAAARGPIGHDSAWSTEAEANYASYSNEYGSLHLSGVRVQGGLIKNKFEAALRYAVLVPDNNFSVEGVQITGRRPIQEITPAFHLLHAGTRS